MSTIQLEEKYILEYVKEILTYLKANKVCVDAKYHHNTDYLKTPSIIENGILSLDKLNERKIREFSKEQLEILNDTNSHINGSDGISLSVVGLQDLYKDEDEYNPLKSDCVDILISSLVPARRTTNHYGNEFIATNIIEPNMFESIDIRLLKYIETLKDIKSIGEVIDKYNSLRLIAKSLKDNKVDIPIREMSNEDEISLDLDGLIDLPILEIK